MSDNPLKQYFRQPAIYIKLPSEGRFYGSGALEPTANGEYPVLPMTTLDEITYRTPDALFNGAAVVSVIQSCIPNIKNAWLMPNVDIDTVLVAIRIATYGHELELDTQCPNCQTVDTYGLDLRTVLDSIKSPDYSKNMPIGDLEIYFRPMTYQQINENGLAQFEDQKVLQSLNDETIDERTRITQVSEVLKKITTVTTNALAKNISVIKTPHAQVENPDHIAEWLANCDRTMFTRIRDHILENKKSSEIKPLKIKCDNCQHEYEQPFTLDMANFFEVAS